MCTIIVTIRTVLWAVMTIAGSLMILVSLFTDRWIIGGFTSSQSLATSFSNAANKFNDFASGRDVDEKLVAGIFLDCVKPEGGLVGLLTNIKLNNIFLFRYLKASASLMLIFW